MLMNYHEMTINEPNDSPAKRKQFAVICAVMAACVSYAVMTSGILLPVEVTDGIFPGGNFCYKLSQRDYAASFGLGRRLTKDMLGEGTTRSTGTTDDDEKAKKSSSTSAQRNEVEEITYHLFLDNPHEMGGRRLRWATGILVSDKEKDKVKHLLSLNQPSGKGKGKTKRYPTDEEMIDLSASEVMDLLPYEVADLPSVDSLVAQFPHTHGFVSALVMSYKVRTTTFLINNTMLMVVVVILAGRKHNIHTNPRILTICFIVFLVIKNRSFPECENWHSKRVGRGRAQWSFPHVARTKACVPFMLRWCKRRTFIWADRIRKLTKKSCRTNPSF